MTPAAVEVVVAEMTVGKHPDLHQVYLEKER
jgi:hypothetical protein